MDHALGTLEIPPFFARAVADQDETGRVVAEARDRFLDFGAA